MAPWNFAGGHALLIGAGGKIVDRKGKPVEYHALSFDGVIGGRRKGVDALLANAPSAGAAVARRPATPSRRTPLASQLARAQVCLLGQLAGDALGSAVEFRTEAGIACRHPDGVTRLADGGHWNLIAGQPTDDSELALALARGVVAETGFDARAVSAAYVSWWQSGPFDIGGTISGGIAALAAGRMASSDSRSDGALMRVNPLGIFAKGDPALAARLAEKDAALTHPHPVCRAASAAYTAAISVGIACGGPEKMWAAGPRPCRFGP